MAFSARSGYHVKLIFLNLPNLELAIARVAARVSQGGHHVPVPVIRRRFDSGLKNFHDIYKRLVNSWALYDNSAEKPRLIEMGDNP